MEHTTKRRWFERFFWMNSLITIVGVLALVGAALSGIGYANEFFDLNTAFLLLRYAVFVCIAMVVLALFSAFLAKKNGSTPRMVISLVLFILCSGVALNVFMQVKTARSVPFIHDVTTDLVNVPEFSVLNPQNPRVENWLEKHKEGYADLTSITLDMDVEAVITKAAEISEGFGWNVASVDHAGGRLEVTETTLWFQFKDDMVVRVTANESGGSIVDARSVSRVGGSDIGVNAKRIRKLFAALQQ